MKASICMDCYGPCTPHADPDSHGICEHCLTKRCPNMPSSKKHIEAMHRGYLKLIENGCHRLAEGAEFK